MAMLLVNVGYTLLSGITW